MYTYIYIYIYIYIYRLPPLPPTSKTRVTEELMLGAPCCSRWVPFGLDGRSPWAPFWSPWPHLGHCLGGFGWHVDSTGSGRVLK